MCPFDARAWLIWTASAALSATLVRNPIYTLIIILVSRIVAQNCSQPGKTLGFSFWRFSLIILLFSALFNAAFAHLGETILWRFPASWPLIGGSITLEAMVMGIVNGLVIVALLSVFMTLNSSVPVSDLVKLTPRAFHDLGVVMLVALTYVPETARHLERIRDAQAVRGHQLKGIRDWRPILVPLLVGGLERAMTLAEAMVSRGYGATTDKPQDTTRLGLLVLGLLLALAGWATALWVGWPGWILLGASIVLLFAVIWRAGQSVKHTVYRVRRWHMTDTLLTITAIVPLAFIIALGVQGGSGSLNYLPYPRMSWPVIQPALALSLLLLLFPAVGSRLIPE